MSALSTRGRVMEVSSSRMPSRHTRKATSIVWGGFALPFSPHSGRCRGALHARPVAPGTLCSLRPQPAMHSSAAGSGAGLGVLLQKDRTFPRDVKPMPHCLQELRVAANPPDPATAALCRDHRGVVIFPAVWFHPFVIFITCS